MGLLMSRLGIRAASSAADMPNTLCGFPFGEKRISLTSAQAIWHRSTNVQAESQILNGI